MTINKDKTIIIHFWNKNNPRSNFEFKCGQLLVGYENTYRSLGLHINEFMDYKYTVHEITKSASRALSALYSKFISCGGMTNDVYNKLYKSLVEPVLYYGADL